jgi:hypothetical protein
VIGEKENRERSPAENPPLQNAIGRNLKVLRKQLIINEMFCEATGVELFSVLTTRKLLISRNCHNGKKGSIAQPIVRLLYDRARHGEPVSGAAA